MFKVLHLHVLPLAYFRKEGEDDDSFVPRNNEKYSITWVKDGEVLEKWRDRVYVTILEEEAVGKYTVHVEFSTDEVLVDKDGILSSVREYEVTSRCPST